MSPKMLTPKAKRELLTIIIFAAVFLSGIIVFNVTPLNVKKTYNQTVTTSDGVPICYDVFEPANDLTAKKPAVIIGHGVMVNKEMMRLIALELAKNGFVVVAFDFRGHGQSGGTLPPSSMAGITGVGGIEQLASDNESGLTKDILAIKGYLEEVRNDINMTNLGYVGYSMGGGAGFELLSHDNDFNAMVGLAPLPNYKLTNTSNPRNLLILSGGLDESNPMDALLKVMANKTSVPASSIELNHLYGSFANGTAAKMIVDPYVEHFFTPYDSNFVREIVNWNLQALQGIATPPADFAYPVLVLAVIIAMIGALGLFWGVSGPIIAHFAHRKVDVPVSSPILETTSKSYLIGRFLMYGLVLSLPCIFTGAFLLWTPLFVSTLLFMFLAGPSLAILLMVWRTYARKGIGFAAMYRSNVATTSGRNILVGVGLGGLLYALLELSGGNLLGIVPSVTRLRWVPLYYVAIVFALINLLFFALPLVADKFGRGRKNGVIIAGTINFLLNTAIYGAMLLVICLVLQSFFLIIFIIPTIPIFGVIFFTCTYYYLRTNDVVMPAITVAVFWAFVIITLSPYFG